MKFIAYYRVSTKKQGSSGLGLQAQKNSITAWANHSADLQKIGEFTEVESGKNDDRQMLRAAIEQCVKHDATLVIAKLDRLSRNVAFLMHINEMVSKGKLKVMALDVPQFNTLSVGIMATMAQHEREVIAERTRKAIQAKKARGEKVGREFTKADRKQSAIAKRLKHKNDQQTKSTWGIVSILLERYNGNYSKTANDLNARGITTPKGGQWQAVQVQRLEKLMTT